MSELIILNMVLSKKSCLTNLLVFMEKVTNYIHSGFPVDVIYSDFQKAFDKVPHRRDY